MRGIIVGKCELNKSNAFKSCSMKKLYTCTLFLVLPIVILCQETEVTPLPNQIDSSFADSVLNRIIHSNTKIVVLGEENHGGELTNQINTEIINRLVTEHGFKTLVFESDFFSLLQTDSLRDSNTFRNNVYSAWSASVAFEKVEKLFLNGKLNFLGFDSRHHGEFSRLYLVDYLKMQQTDTFDFSELFYTISASLLENEFRDTLLSDHSQEYFAYVEKWQNNLEDTTDLLFHVLTNLKNYARQLLYESRSGPEEYVAFREFAMIANMEYLLSKRVEQEKYIILGANLHIQPGITGASKHASKNIGDYIFEHYLNESSFLLPVVYSGKTQSYSSTKPQKVSEKGKRKTMQRKLAKTHSYALINYCYDADSSLFPSAVTFENKEFCGYFVFINEEKPRSFYEKSK